MSSAGFSGEISAAGVAFAVVSALSWALGTVYFKKVQERVSMLWAVALPFLSGGILLSILGLATERPADISWSGSYIASLLYSGLVGMGLAWVLWLRFVRAGEASRVAAYMFFVPLVSVVTGAVFLDERLGLSLLVGAALVVSGIHLANRTPGEDKKPLKRSACCEKMRARGKERRNIEQQTRPPFPPIDEESARQKIKAAQDAWNTRDPEKVSLAYTEDSRWRNRDEFFQGREAIRDFLTRKWARGLDYRLEKNLWYFTGNRIAVRFEYESRDAEGNWWRRHTYDRIATPSYSAAAGCPRPGVLTTGASKRRRKGARH